jgi:zinc protease
MLARSNLKVAAVGDIDAATLGQTLDRVFGELPAEAKPTTIRDRTLQGGGKRVVVSLNVPQSVVRMGGAGVPRKDPDFMAAYIVNHILGGGSFTSRLYGEVREKRGLVYGVSSYLLTLRHSALFMVSTQASNEHTREAVDLIEAAIRRMADEGPTEAELSKAKAYLKGAYVLNLDTSGKIASVLLQNQLDDLGIDYIDRRQRMIDAVTVDDARRAAKRLGAGGLLTTVVGEPKDLASREPGP